MNNMPFIRSEDRWLAGVCGGLAEKFEVEAWIVRAATLVSVFYFGIGLGLYFLAAICFPKKENAASHQPRVLGVCQQLAIKYDWDVGLLRFLSCLLALSSLGLAIVLYLVIAVVMPKKNASGGR